MAWYECLYGGGGGNTTVHPVLIGQFTSNSNGTVTRTLSESIANYKYLLFTMTPITSDSVWSQLNTPNGGMSFADIDYFRNNAVKLSYGGGNSGSGTFPQMTLTYVSDTTFTTQTVNTATRTLYVYGIKDMPSWGNLPTATGTFTPTTSDLHITLGFKPKQLAVYVAKTDGTTGVLFSYDENVSTTKHLYAENANTPLKFVDLGTTTTYRIKSIDDDGFTITAFTTAAWRGLGHYYAIG